MALTRSTVKVPLGMRRSYYYPITEEPDNSRPTYDAKLDMGTAVKGYLSVTTASGTIPGDDVTQVEIEKFVSGQLDAETTMNELEVNAKIYGHAFSAETGEVSNSNDVSINGGYGFIEPILTKEKQTIYRTTALLKVSAMASAEKQEADTKKSGELSFKNYAVSYKVMECSNGDWRIRKDFESMQEAESFLDTTFGQNNVAATSNTPNAGAQQST